MNDITVLVLGFILGVSVCYVVLELYRNRKQRGDD